MKPHIEISREYSVKAVSKKSKLLLQNCVRDGQAKVVEKNALREVDLQFPTSVRGNNVSPPTAETIKSRAKVAARNMGITKDKDKEGSDDDGLGPVGRKGILQIKDGNEDSDDDEGGPTNSAPIAAASSGMRISAAQATAESDSTKKGRGRGGNSSAAKAASKRNAAKKKDAPSCTLATPKTDKRPRIKDFMEPLTSWGIV